MKAFAPLVGLLACVRTGDIPEHSVMDKYVAAVRDGAGGLAVIVPPPVADDPAAADPGPLLDRLDALLLPGSLSNIDPVHYGQAAAAGPAPPADPARDRFALRLIREAARRDLPVLAICRGFQELNVALGGTLHQAVHALPWAIDHREDRGAAAEARYAPAHAVEFEPGLLRDVAGPSARVNSLHGQGVDRLAPALAPLARAPDGLVEAACLPDARFILGVQWHPEWRHADTALGRGLFAAFGDAARARLAAAGGRARPAAA